jgi:hypothetical protein
LPFNTHASSFGFPSERFGNVNFSLSASIRAHPRTAPERGCVEDQPQQLGKTGLLQYA